MSQKNINNIEIKVEKEKWRKKPVSSENGIY